MTNEKFYHELAKTNHRFLKPKPLVFKSKNLNARHRSWLLHIGLMETWSMVSI